MVDRPWKKKKNKTTKTFKRKAMKQKDVAILPESKCNPQKENFLLTILPFKFVC